MLSIGGTSPMAMERHTANWGLYEETARANGHVPDRKNWRVVGMFHIAETREQARRNVQFGVQSFANYFRDVATFPIIPPEVPDPTDWLIESGTGCIGTPDDAIAYIERLIAGSGGFGVICELAQNWADWEATKRHYELMARFVHPHFQQSRELLQGSYDYATSHHVDFTGQAAAAIEKEIDRHAARRAAEAKTAGGKKEAGANSADRAEARDAKPEPLLRRSRPGRLGRGGCDLRGARRDRVAPARPARAGAGRAWIWSAARSSRRSRRWRPRRARSRNCCMRRIEVARRAPRRCSRKTRAERGRALNRLRGKTIRKR